MQPSLPSVGSAVTVDRYSHVRPRSVERVTKPYLRKIDVEAVMKRRDLIIQHFDKLVAEKGEKEVLY